MAESKEVRHSAGIEERSGLRPLRQVGSNEPEWGRYEPSLLRELGGHLAPLRRYWRTIAIVTLAATVGGWAASHLLLTKVYRAEAIIKPMSAEQTMGLMQGLVMGGGSGPWSALMGSQYNSSAAEEDLTILGSYTFLTNLAKKHQMDAQILEHAKLRSGVDESWMVYRVLSGRFSNKYSIKSGNLNLTYLDKNRQRAAKVLGWEISDLRQILRAREVRNAAAAASSLEQQVKNVSDTLLARQLYELIAKQIQREKLAEVQADFAFDVLQPPVTPDHPAWPHNTLNGLLVGFLTFCAVCGTIVFWNLIRPASREAGQATSSAGGADRV